MKINTTKLVRHKYFISAVFMALFVAHGPAFAIKSIDFTGLPVFDLEEYEVIYNQTDFDFDPQFNFKSPNFSYFEVPELPKGELILALDFIDRYRQATIPGKHKWAGLLTFPMIDGQERHMIKWLCLYMYGNVMYGYDPSPRDEESSRIVTTTILGPMTVASDMNMNMEMNRRFVVPIQYEDRTKASVLFKFAESYVESVSPMMEDTLVLDAFSYGEEGFDDMTIEIPAGRIAPILSSQRDKEPEELVRLVYQFYEEPNPGMSADATMGPDDDFMRITWNIDVDLSLANLDKELGGLKIHDHIALAKALLAPRWSQKIKFHYKKGLLFWNLDNVSSVLLFNVANRLYAYSPYYGVWKTDAHASHLENPELLKSKLKYPGIENVERIELIPN